MSMSGLALTPTKCGPRAPVIGLSCSSRRISAFSGVDRTQEQNIGFPPRSRSWAALVQRCSLRRTYIVKSAMDASYGGDRTDKESAVFPRIHVRDPYKRLGISTEASEDEVQSARNFLIQKYGGHKPSADAIESALDKIIMQKYHERKNPKIDLNKKVREVKQSRFVQAVTNRFRTPSTMVIAKTAIAFLILGALTILFPTEEGPTLQVAISLAATMYFIYDRLKSKLRAVLYGYVRAAAFIFSWLIGTFLMVSVIPPLPMVRGPRSFEVTTSLLSYVLLWVSSTYLK
ncbi:Protein CHAPERONE-LIKE PROTEIN OF POR1, chloroplastic [Linum grandiflorum]